MKCNIPNNDLNQRLNGTICRYAGRPVLVRCEGGDHLSLWDVTGANKVIDIVSSDPMFDISSLPLGYVQVNPFAVVYVTRKPARLWKQGITMDSLNYGYVSQIHAQLVRFTCFSKGFEDSVLGKFPSFQHAKALARTAPQDGRKTTDIALSRDVAISYQHDMELTHVFFKGEKVGFIIKEEDTVITPSREYGWIISKNLSQLDWKVE